MTKKFEMPDFEKDPVRKILKKSWDAFQHKLDEVWDEVKDLKKSHDNHTRNQDATNIEVAGIRGQMSILVKMGAGVLTLLVALLAAVIAKA